MKYIDNKVYFNYDEERELLGYLTNKLRCPFSISNKRCETIDGLVLYCADVEKLDGKDYAYVDNNRQTNNIK